MTELPANFRGDRRLAHVNHHAQPGSTWRFAMAGLCASLVGLGLARFAYTPLIPALITAKWFSASDVVYLGAANLAGYLAGALLARPIAARLGSTWALRAMMMLPRCRSLHVRSRCRSSGFSSGGFSRALAGGIIMVLAASVVLPHTSPAKRGIVGGVIFAGVGLGIAASGTLVPLLLQQGLRESWYGLGALSALLTLISWTSWPKEVSPRNRLLLRITIHRGQSKAPWALLLEYGLNAVRAGAAMVFLVDFVARGLGQGISTGSNYWVRLRAWRNRRTVADRTYRRPDRIRAGLARLLPDRGDRCPASAISTTPASLIVSSVVIGGFTPGIVPLVLGRIHELVPHSAEQQRAVWSHATTSFALFQAAAAYGFSWLFARDGDYLLLFRLGGGAVTLALAIELVMALAGARKAAR